MCTMNKMMMKGVGVALMMFYVVSKCGEAAPLPQTVR